MAPSLILQIDEKNREFIVIGDGKKLFVVNPDDHSWSTDLFHFQFGAYACTHLLVFANGMDSGLEEAAGWLASHAPGTFVDIDTKEIRDDLAKKLGVAPSEIDDEDLYEVWDEVTVDLTYTESGYIASYKWWVNDADEATITQPLIECLKASDDDGTVL